VAGRPGGAHRLDRGRRAGRQAGHRHAGPGPVTGQRAGSGPGAGRGGLALLAFRDALRADDALRAEYATLKQRLAAEHATNRNAYTNAKAEFVARVLRRAGTEPPPRGLLPE
jgi:GrpB protein